MPLSLVEVKALSSISSNPSGKITFFKVEIESKAFLPIYLTILPGAKLISSIETILAMERDMSNSGIE